MFHRLGSRLSEEFGQYSHYACLSRIGKVFQHRTLQITENHDSSTTSKAILVAVIFHIIINVHIIRPEKKV